MSEVLLGILIVCCLLILSQGLKRQSRMIQYPFLVAGVYLGWVVPQFLGLTQNPYLPPGALSKTLVMAILCLGAVYFGYTVRPRPARMFWWQFDERRLLIASLVLSLLGAYFFFQVSQLAAEVTAEHGGAWTGVITIYVFFARLLTIGMVIAIILHMMKPQWQTLVIISFDLLFYIERIIIQGRRAEMVELALIAMMVAWFHRRWLPPRWVIVGGVIGVTLLINSIGDYRSTMLDEDRVTWSGAGLDQIMEIDFIGNLQKIAEGELESHDLKNAVMNIEAVDHLLVFDYWLSIWNQLVTNFLPGQWIGHDLKQALILEFDNDARAYRDYVPHSGSTMTGFSDAFQSFWYFGAIKFFLAGLIMRRWYQAGVNGNIVAQMIMMLIISDSLHLITHSTMNFYMGFIELAIFLLPVLLLARIKLVRYGAQQSHMAEAPALPWRGA